MTHGQQVKYRNNLSYEKVSDYVLNLAIINTLLDIKYAVNFLCLMLNPPSVHAEQESDCYTM